MLAGHVLCLECAASTQLLTLPAFMRTIVRPTRRACASLWLTQIIARPLSSSNQSAMRRSKDTAVGAFQGRGRLVEAEHHRIKLQRADEGRDLGFTAGQFRDVLRKKRRVAPRRESIRTARSRSKRRGRWTFSANGFRKAASTVSSINAAH